MNHENSMEYKDSYLQYAYQLKIGLPSLIISEFSWRVVDEWCRLTGTKAGIWGWAQAVPYTRDEEIGSGFSFEGQPFNEWATPQNQHALMQLCQSISLDDNPGVIVEVGIDEKELERSLGDYFQDGYEDGLVSPLRELLENNLLKWVIWPLGPDVEFCVIVCSKDGEPLIRKMACFCTRSGIEIEKP
ncbi:MAG: hypothetical protein JW818_05065 [Pirellulales bacterium]|nr:hypothetical protein [Pirellulales bacterium]